MKLKGLLHLAILPLILSSCSNEEVVKPNDKWTILVYMCGSNLESGKTNGRLNALATADIKEMVSVKNQPKDVNIVIETGGANKWSKTYGISADNNQRYHIRDNKLVLDETLPTYQNMGDSKTLQSFLEWGIKKYPSDKIGLVLWNHGGAMSGVCFDEKTDDGLLNSEVKAAVKGAFSTLKRTEKLEFIGYDACLMSVQDIADYNSAYFNYMVASEETELGYGWEYSKWIDNVYNDDDTELILTELCDSFVNVGEELASYYPDYQNDQTCAFFDLNKFPKYKLAFERLAGSLKSNIKSNMGFINFMKEVQDYGDGDDFEGYEVWGTFDIIDFLDKLSENSTYNVGLEQLISNVKEKYYDMLKYNRSGIGAGNSNGLALYFPCDYGCASEYVYVESETNFTNWKTIVDVHGY